MQTRFVFPAALFFIIVCLYLYYLSGNPAVFPLDDAYIHFVYARNLACGHGLSFNSGETSFGTSSPLWIGVLALCAKSGIDLYYASLAISFFCYLASALLVFFIVRETKEFRNSPLYPFLAGLLYVSSGNMTWLSLSGMETVFFQMLCLYCLYLYLKRGYDLAAGFIAGMVVLCRVTGLFFIIPLLAVDIYKEKKISPSVIVTFFMVLPYYLYHKVLTGAFFPVTARGKVLTYVHSGWDMADIINYLSAVFKYLILYEPAFFIAVIIVVSGLIVGRFQKNKTGNNMNVCIIILSSWLVFHLAIHSLMFRTLNHNFRYLAVLFPGLSILAVCYIRCIVRNRFLALTACFALILLSFSNQLFWKKLYRNNTHHMEKVYVECADWIDKNTNDISIAAFDIGIIKYLTGRYVIDLGGVTDRSIHPYLETHDAGRFIHKKGASLIVYSRFPDCDVWPGIYRSAYDREGILKESDLASFKTEYYEAPSITHSFQLDVSRVDDWIIPTDPALKEFFYTEMAPGYKHLEKKLGNNMELVSVESGRKEIEVVRNMSQYTSLTYCWTATARITEKPVIRTRFINEKSGKVIFVKKHIPTHDIFQPELWDTGKIVCEKHVVWIPQDSPPGTYEVWINLENSDGAEIKAAEFTINTSLLNILY